MQKYGCEQGSKCIDCLIISYMHVDTETTEYDAELFEMRKKRTIICPLYFPNDDDSTEK